MSPGSVYATAVFSGICAGIWPAAASTKPVLRDRTPEVLLNIYFAAGVCVTSLLLLPLADASVDFTTYGLLSGAMLVTGSCITFTTTRILGITTTYSMVIGCAMYTRLFWDYTYFHENTVSIRWTIGGLCTLLVALRLVAHVHLKSLRLGIATVNLELYGVSEKSQFWLRGTSVRTLKHYLWSKFWDEDIDLGDVNSFRLQLFDREFDEYVDLDHVEDLPNLFENADLRVAPMGYQEPSILDGIVCEIGDDDPNLSNDTDSLIAPKKKTKVLRPRSEKAMAANEAGNGRGGGGGKEGGGAGAGADGGGGGGAGKEGGVEEVGGAPVTGNGIEDLPTPATPAPVQLRKNRAEEFQTKDSKEVNRRLQLVDPLPETKIMKRLKRWHAQIRGYYVFAMLAGFCIGSVDIPALRESGDYSEGRMLAYFPVMGIGALLISPTLPMHKQCASCASFHLSRQCNTTPSLPHSAGVTLSGGESDLRIPRRN